MFEELQSQSAITMNPDGSGQVEVCQTCKGNGQKYPVGLCATCHGSGYPLWSKEHLEFHKERGNE